MVQPPKLLQNFCMIGITVENTKDFESEYKGPHFMAVRYRFGPPMSGKLIYPAAFGAG